MNPSITLHPKTRKNKIKYKIKSNRPAGPEVKVILKVSLILLEVFLRSNHSDVYIFCPGLFRGDEICVRHSGHPFK